MVSTPVILAALSGVVSPTVGVSATSTAIAWIVLLMSAEGLVRGQFVAVLVRFFVFLVLVVAAYFLWVDWRYVVSGLRFAGAVTALWVSIREVARR